jgi:hypothetical protein
MTSSSNATLERIARRVPVPEAAYERMLHRRDRKRRNQRIAAGLVGIAVFVAAVWIVTSVGSFDQSQTPAVPGPDTGPTETGSTVAPDPDAEGIKGLPPEGATPSTPASGELIVELAHQVWVYADGRVISRVFLPTLEPYSGLGEQHLTPEGVEFLRSSVLSTGLFEHDLDLARSARRDPEYLEIRVRDGDRLVRVTWFPRYGPRDHEAPMATLEQATALQSLYELLTRQAWPASVWMDKEIRPYVPTRYSFCSRWGEPSRVLALLPEPARDLLLSAGYPTTYGSGQAQPACARVTTEEARALAGILISEGGRRGDPSLGFSLEEPGPGNILIAINPVLPHGESAGVAGLG